MLKRRMKRAALTLGCAALVLLMAVGATQTKQVSGGEKPLSGLTVLLDAGHGGDDGGARGRVMKLWEKSLNLDVALKTRERLVGMGCKVLMTREKDLQYDRNKRRDLDARLDIAREGGADFLVSIHMNEYRASSESGPQVFYRAGQEQSRLFAGAMQQALIDGLSPRKERVALSGDYYMLSLDIPSILVECGFLSNREEEAMLGDDAYRQKIAAAIASGVAEFAALRQIAQ